jgi:DNA repair protein RecN (Recombination protein N)
MLEKIHIKNFALIKNLEIKLFPGLNVFTGETGAGKSIIIESLGFILGGRSSADIIREGEDFAEVEAVFNIEAFSSEFFKKYSLKGPQLFIKRQLSGKGKSKAFINSTPKEPAKQISISKLAEIGDSIIDFHGQNDHQSLLKSSVHRELLDRYAKLESEVSKLKEVRLEKKVLEQKSSALKMSAQEKERLLDLYKYQLNEIEEASLNLGEDEELKATFPKLKNGEKLLSLSNEAYQSLYLDDNSASVMIERSFSCFESLAEMDKTLLELKDRLESVKINLEDIASEMRVYSSSINNDPDELEDCLKRLDIISRLSKKYGGEIKDILAFAENLRDKISDLENTDIKQQDINSRLEIISSELQIKAEALHKKRMTFAQKLSKEVKKEIANLGFKNARFSVSVQADETDIGPSGYDDIEFLFSANAGQSLKPLKYIASGGEMSRIMLGLKTVFSDSDKVPILVFDEIDTGVGSVVGRLVGEKLFSLASDKQLFCITHMAQIASFANTHFFIEKKMEKNTTEVSIKLLNAARHKSEIARLLSGKVESTSLGLKHASELIDETDKIKASTK